MKYVIRNVITPKLLRTVITPLNSGVSVFMSKESAWKYNFDEMKYYDRPFFIRDLGNIERQVCRWYKNLPGFRPFYAVKCNPDPRILETLAIRGAGFDCASSAEIEIALATGVTGDDIIFANPIKTDSDISFARSKGVKKMTFDNIGELQKIAVLFPDAELILRLLTDDSGSNMRFGCKFGADEKYIPVLLTCAHSLSLKVIGVSFHNGGGCFKPELFADAIAMCKRVFEMSSKLGLPKLYLVDIGGGFPGNEYRKDLSFEAFADVILSAMDTHFPVHQFPQLQTIGEPGRYLVESCSTLFTKVIGKRVGHKIIYYLNDGVYGSLNGIIFDQYTALPVPVIKRECTDKMSTFYGPTCDSMDKVVDNYVICNLLIGDWVMFEFLGAYSDAAASRFNGMPLATVRHVYIHTNEIM